MKPYYQDDRSGITIYHADCHEILPHLPPVDCIVTSPPYNQLGSRIPDKPSGMWARSHGGAGFARHVRADGYADDMEESEYQAWQNDLFSTLAAAHTTSNASLFYNHQCRWRDGVALHPIQWFRPAGWNLRQEIVWDRAGGMMMNARMFCRFDERIIWFTKDRWVWNQESVGRGTIWRLAREQYQQGKQHPCSFPIEIPLYSITATTFEGNLILDPFMGSGTTLAAAKQVGRRAIGIEIEEKYCEIAVKRLAQERLEFEPPTPQAEQEPFTFGGEI